MRVRRLKSKAQFQALLACPPVARTEHFVMHRLALPKLVLDSAEPSRSAADTLFKDGDLWQGAMVPKRWSRRAVTRNLIKRQIYSPSLWSSAWASAAPAAFLVRQRATFSLQQFKSAASSQLKQAVQSELQQLFKRAGVRMQTEATP